MFYTTDPDNYRPISVLSVIVRLLFLDLHKAFDTVSHDIQLKKMEHYGIRCVELNWFQSYLSKRHQCCAANDIASKYSINPAGVPQGSCLGPLLF